MKRETECTSARIDLCAYLQLLLLLSFARKKRYVHTQKEIKIFIWMCLIQFATVDHCSFALGLLRISCFLYISKMRFCSAPQINLISVSVCLVILSFSDPISIAHIKYQYFFFRSSESFHFYALQTRQSMIFIADLFESACIWCVQLQKNDKDSSYTKVIESRLDHSFRNTFGHSHQMHTHDKMTYKRYRRSREFFFS